MIIIILICIVFYLSYNRQYVTKFLKNNNYIIDEIDELIYNKNITNNNIDDYYNSIDNNNASEYRSFSVSLEDKTLTDTYLFCNNSISIIYDFTTNKTTYNYEIINDINNITITGKYNGNNLSCNVKDNSKINNNTLNDYCETAKNEMIVFLKEKNIFINDKTFIKNITK